MLGLLIFFQLGFGGLEPILVLLLLALVALDFLVYLAEHCGVWRVVCGRGAWWHEARCVLGRLALVCDGGGLEAADRGRHKEHGEQLQ